MTRISFTFALVAAAALAGCNEQDHTIVQGGPPDPMANAVTNAAAVELPPAIAASKIYRCKDNSLVYVDWLADNKTVNFRADKAATPVQLKAPDEGQPMVAEGYSLAGSATAPTITLTRPDKGSQSCKA